MSKYDIDFKRLAVLLLPTALRRPRLSALAQVLMAPMSRLGGELGDYRKDKDYRLSHNGQTCYLRAVLNDRFDPVLRRITITEESGVENAILLYQRSQHRAIVVSRRIDGNAQRIVYRRNYGGIGNLDFWVNVPRELVGQENYSDDGLRALVNLYKLASKRYDIIYN